MYMYEQSLFMVANHQIRHQANVKFAVNLVNVMHMLLNLSQGFVWLCMGLHTHFITPEGVYAY